MPGSRTSEVLPVLSLSDVHITTDLVSKGQELQERQPERHWRWRLQMARWLAAVLDTERFGVEAMYVFGSTKNATAGPGSDIDLLLHIRSTDEQRRDLDHWLNGWSRRFAEINTLRTGYHQDQLLDVHLITDEDIKKRTSFAVKIGATTDAARPLPLRMKKSGKSTIT